MKSEPTQHVLKEYARLAGRYDRRWAFYIRATAWETIQRLRLKSTERLLDVGCGTGALLEAVCNGFPELEAAGVDPSQEMLQAARRKLKDRIILSQGWAEALPFPEGSFDVVVSCSAFHFCREPAQALREFCRVLKPDGRIVITDWCRDYVTCRVLDFFLYLFNRAHHKTYTGKEGELLLKQARFSSISMERYKINWFWGMMTITAKRGGHKPCPA